jgi:hypothetical protein
MVAQIGGVVDEIRRAGATTFQSIADGLNARGIPTARDGQWYPTTVAKSVVASRWLRSNCRRHQVFYSPAPGRGELRGGLETADTPRLYATTA